MKIVHVVNSLDVGGTEKSACLLARCAQILGHEAGVYFKKTGARFEWAKELLGDQEHSLCGLTTDPGPHVLLEYLREVLKPDIVHLHRGHIHGPSPSLLRELCPKAKVVITHVFGEWDHDADLTIYVSAEMLAQRAPLIRDRGIPLTKFAILPNPVRPAHTLAKLDGLPEETLILGSMGRPDSNIYEPTHLQALALFMARQPERKVLYIRMGASDAEKADLVRLQIPHRLIEPTCSDGAISRFLNSLDVYLHSRRDGESDGMAIAEAMVHGRRVISHACGIYRAHISQLAEFTEFSRMVAPHDSVAYADAITEFAEDDRGNRIAEQEVPRRVLERRGVDVIGSRLMALYEDLVR